MRDKLEVEVVGSKDRGSVRAELLVPLDLSSRNSWSSNGSGIRSTAVNCTRPVPLAAKPSAVQLGGAVEGPHWWLLRRIHSGNKQVLRQLNTPSLMPWRGIAGGQSPNPSALAGLEGEHLECSKAATSYTGDLNRVCTRPVGIAVLLGVRSDSSFRWPCLPRCCAACGWVSSCEPASLGRPPRRLDMDGKEHFGVSSTGGDGGGWGAET
jgi:hypothetical protein